MSSPLPPISDIFADPSDTAPLCAALSLLFEPSPVLINVLAPALAAAPPPMPHTYPALLAAAMATIAAWDPATQAAFVGAHPRIGEVHGLSALSAQEQAAAHVTSPAVLARLAELNARYEARFPGLRYVTFVNGRTRAEVAEEMEGRMSGAAGGEGEVVEVGSGEWVREVGRAVGEVGRIAGARMKRLCAGVGA